MSSVPGKSMRIEIESFSVARLYLSAILRNSMHDTANPRRNHEPYGLLGLCVSVVVILCVALILTAAIVAAAGLLASIVFGWHFVRGFLLDATTPQQGEGTAPLRLVLIIALGAYVAVVGAIIAVARWRGGMDWQALVAWQKTVWRMDDKLLWAIAATALVYSFAVTAALSYFYPQSDSWFTIPSDRIGRLLLFVLAVVLAPITEELMFRGWIYTSLRFSFGLWPAILVSAALFGGAHYEDTHLYALAVFPVGIALAAIRERTGSVKASMLFHAVNNFIAFCAAALNIG
jgi:membrane protease YdiL (CAAX protease family)